MYISAPETESQPMSACLAEHIRRLGHWMLTRTELTLYRMVMPIGTPFLKEKINN